MDLIPLFLDLNMKKHFDLIRSLLFLLLLIFGTIFVRVNTNGIKHDNLIDNYNFTYIPFVIIYLLLIIASNIYDFLYDYNFKHILSNIFVFLLLLIVLIFGINIQKFNLAYSFKYGFVILNVYYFIYTFCLLVNLYKRKKDK